MSYCRPQTQEMSRSARRTAAARPPRHGSREGAWAAGRRPTLGDDGIVTSLDQGVGEGFAASSFACSSHVTGAAQEPL